nr:diacylglycerol kinase iota-like [Salvelinus alpinus]
MPDLVVEPNSGSPLTSEEQAMLTAASSGDLTTLSGSFFRGTSLLVRDFTGCSALHLASQHGHTEVVRFILEHGSKVLLDLTNRETGDTALHKAASQKHHTVCRLLMDSGASLIKTNFKVRTSHTHLLILHHTHSQTTVEEARELRGTKELAFLP